MVDGASGELDPAFAEWLEAFDELLAQQDVPLHERPLRAAALLARYAVAQASENGVETTVDKHVGFGDLLEKRWFGSLVRMSESWYARIVGAAALQPPESSAFGTVVHRGAIQLIKIPLVVTHSAEIASQQWIAFPDHVGDDEDVLEWLQPALGRSAMHPDELAALSAKVKKVAHSIRYIASRSRNASRGSDELAGLLAGGLRNLQAFAHFAVVGDRPERQKAWWELQMANESFLKALCLQKGTQGGYRKTHSLQDLVRDAQQHGLDFAVSRLNEWPCQKEMGHFRYATGRRVSSAELLHAYELSIAVCEAAAASLRVHLDTGKAQFLIQPLPWRLRELEKGPA
ncbi:MAG: hypothetical protein Q8O42_07570 [Acidobacteriota bacterium]|nr:hypothetical protein [Acidobacteriota bacterium]